MKLRNYFIAIAVMACGSLFAQNATKAELDKLTNQVNVLSQRMTELENKATMFETKVTQLEADVERIVTENVNLVEQLNIKTITSVMDVNNIQWDIVKVEPNTDTNDVQISLRLTNKSGVKQKVFMYTTYSYALDSDTNRNDNKYDIVTPGDIILEHEIPVNTTITIRKVPLTSSYLSMIQLGYTLKPIYVKFTGVHIPW